MGAGLDRSRPDDPRPCELVLRDKEHIQPRAGRLDLQLQDRSRLATAANDPVQSALDHAKAPLAPEVARAGTTMLAWSLLAT